MPGALVNGLMVLYLTGVARGDKFYMWQCLEMQNIALPSSSPNSSLTARADCGPRLLGMDALPMVVSVLNVSSSTSARHKLTVMRLNNINAHALTMKRMVDLHPSPYMPINQHQLSELYFGQQIMFRDEMSSMSSIASEVNTLSNRRHDVKRKLHMMRSGIAKRKKISDLILQAQEVMPQIHAMSSRIHDAQYVVYNLTRTFLADERHCRQMSRIGGHLRRRIFHPPCFPDNYKPHMETIARRGFKTSNITTVHASFKAARTLRKARNLIKTIENQETRIIKIAEVIESANGTKRRGQELLEHSERTIMQCSQIQIYIDKMKHRHRRLMRKRRHVLDHVTLMNELKNLNEKAGIRLYNISDNMESVGKCLRHIRGTGPLVQRRTHNISEVIGYIHKMLEALKIHSSLLVEDTTRRMRVMDYPIAYTRPYMYVVGGNINATELIRQAKKDCQHTDKSIKALFKILLNISGEELPKYGDLETTTELKGESSVLATVTTPPKVKPEIDEETGSGAVHSGDGEDILEPTTKKQKTTVTVPSTTQLSSSTIKSPSTTSRPPTVSSSAVTSSTSTSTTPSTTRKPTEVAPTFPTEEAEEEVTTQAAGWNWNRRKKRETVIDRIVNLQQSMKIGESDSEEIIAESVQDVAPVAWWFEETETTTVATSSMFLTSPAFEPTKLSLLDLASNAGRNVVSETEEERDSYDISEDGDLSNPDISEDGDLSNPDISEDDLILVDNNIHKEISHDETTVFEWKEISLRTYYYIVQAAVRRMSMDFGKSNMISHRASLLKNVSKELWGKHIIAKHRVGSEENNISKPSARVAQLRRALSTMSAAPTQYIPRIHKAVSRAEHTTSANSKLSTQIDNIMQKVNATQKRFIRVGQMVQRATIDMQADVVTSKLDDQWEEIDEIQTDLVERHNRMKRVSDGIRENLDDIRRQLQQTRDHIDLIQPILHVDGSEVYTAEVPPIVRQAALANSLSLDVKTSASKGNIITLEDPPNPLTGTNLRSMRLDLRRGRPSLIWNEAGEVHKVTCKQIINDGNWHSIKVERQGKTVKLSSHMLGNMTKLRNKKEMTLPFSVSLSPIPAHIALGLSKVGDAASMCVTNLQVDKYLLWPSDSWRQSNSSCHETEDIQMLLGLAASLHTQLRNPVDNRCLHQRHDRVFLLNLPQDTTVALSFLTTQSIATVLLYQTLPKDVFTVRVYGSTLLWEGHIQGRPFRAFCYHITPNDGQWHHILLRFHNDSSSLYLDGLRCGVYDFRMLNLERSTPFMSVYAGRGDLPRNLVSSQPSAEHPTKFTGFIKHFLINNKYVELDQDQPCEI